MPISANFSNPGLAYLLSGDLNQGAQALRHALELGNSPRTRYLMGLVLLDSKPGIEEACDDLWQARRAGPYATIALAVCYARDGRPSEADAAVRDYFGAQRQPEIRYWQSWVASVAVKPHPSQDFGLRFRASD